MVRVPLPRAARPRRPVLFLNPRSGGGKVDRFQLTDLVDVRLHGDPVGTLPPEVTLHAGSAAVIASVRPLGTDTARLRLSAPLPLRIGDRALLRDPGRHHVAGCPAGGTRRECFAESSTARL